MKRLLSNLCLLENALLSYSADEWVQASETRYIALGYRDWVLYLYSKPGRYLSPSLDQGALV